MPIPDTTTTPTSRGRAGGVEVAEMNGLAAYCATLEGQMSTTTPPLSPTVIMVLSPEEEESQQRKVGAAAGVTVARISVAESVEGKMGIAPVILS